MRVIFLDIDGVLNDHSKLPGSVYCGILPRCVEQLNRVIVTTDCRVVLTSAWRYICLGCFGQSQMTLRGFEYLLLTHGVVWPGCEDMGNLLLGTLPLDCDEHMGSNRGQQIADWIRDYGDERDVYVILDDVPDGMSMKPVEHLLIKTDPAVGLTKIDADKAISLLCGP